MSRPLTMFRRASAVLFACAALLGACGVDGEGTRSNPIGGGGAGGAATDGGTDEDSGSDELAYPGFESCDQEPDGMQCGPSHHCLDEECLPNRCGDGLRFGDEQCDDGNEAIDDDCSPACRMTPDTCGDGEINHEDEQCDDGNLIDGDGCTSACIAVICGDRIAYAGFEECDDGNDDDYDACANACTRNRCRNGRLDPGEQCDDGNRTDDDGCTNACLAITCGDGVTSAPYEECDDGNGNDADECSASCKRIMCGNNRIDAGELCDGSALPDGASGTCQTDCSAVENDTACDACRREQSHCTDYMASGINLVDGCFMIAPPESAPDFVETCAALSACITRSRCDVGLEATDTATACYCGVGVATNDCQDGVVPAAGPCIDAYLAATKCTDNPAPVACALNNSTDLTNAAGYATYLAACDQLYCLEHCR